MPHKRSKQAKEYRLVRGACREAGVPSPSPPPLKRKRCTNKKEKKSTAVSSGDRVGDSAVTGNQSVGVTASGSVGVSASTGPTNCKSEASVGKKDFKVELKTEDLRERFHELKKLKKHDVNVGTSSRCRRDTSGTTTSSATTRHAPGAERRQVRRQ